MTWFCSQIQKISHATTHSCKCQCFPAEYHHIPPLWTRKAGKTNKHKNKSIKIKALRRRACERQPTDQMSTAAAAVAALLLYTSWLLNAKEPPAGLEPSGWHSDVFRSARFQPPSWCLHKNPVPRQRLSAMERRFSPLWHVEVHVFCVCAWKLLGAERACPLFYFIFLSGNIVEVFFTQ